LLVSARTTEGFPDHRAGAALIETLDRLFPELTIDTGPLRTQAELIEKALRAQMLSRPKAGDDRAPPAPTDTPIYQ
jgi:predicted ATP-grasp superfamily ATP-dependent carboligase